MQFFQRRFEAMACACEVQLFATDAQTGLAALDAALEEVKRIEAKFSRYRVESVTSQVNQSAGGEAIAVDLETASLIDFGATCFAQSDGRFDLTSGVLRRAWDFKRGVVPTQAELDALLPLIGWQQVAWQSHAAGGTLRLPKPGMQLDFGGIGKEYAVDRAIGVLQAKDIRHALVNLGGDVRAIGYKPLNEPSRSSRSSVNSHPLWERAGIADITSISPWHIGIEHPRQDGTLCALTLTDGALATSGDYERYFELNGTRYSHLLDATTGWPVPNMWQSVSVQAPLCLVAGAQATLAMLAGRDAGRVLQESTLPWIGVNAKGEVLRGEH